LLNKLAVADERRHGIAVESVESKDDHPTNLPEVKLDSTDFKPLQRSISTPDAIHKPPSNNWCSHSQSIPLENLVVNP
jgi:hypothetical protein